MHWHVEETCLNAFPSLRQAFADGWVLRFADGLSRRANSANALGPDCAPVDAVIEVCEATYRRQGLPPIFRVPSILPAAIDAALATRGYTREGDTCVLHGPIDAIAAGADLGVELLERPTSEWLAAMGALQGHNAEQRSTYRRIVRSVVVPAAFAALRIDGRVAALALGAAHGGLLCYESVITDPRRRRQGLGRRVVASLAEWGREHGATAACLQVEAANAPARALYDGVGLTTELFRYHYRRAPAAVD